MTVLDREILVNVFGEWPSFRESEVMPVVLTQDQRAAAFSNIKAAIRLRKYLSECVGTPEYRLTLLYDCVVDIEFEKVVDVDLVGFNQQNLLYDLHFIDRDSSVGVVFEPIYGASGSFNCTSARVLCVTLIGDTPEWHFPKPIHARGSSGDSLHN